MCAHHRHLPKDFLRVRLAVDLIAVDKVKGGLWVLIGQIRIRTPDRRVAESVLRARPFEPHGALLRS